MEIDVPTLHGPAKLKIPSGSQSGKVFRIKDKGIPHLHSSGRGDQMCVLKVVTPETLTKEQKRLFEELAKSMEPEKK